MPSSNHTHFKTREENATAIKRRSLHAELVERLRDMIIEGELEPGDKIPELALSQRFGVSRTPLREALKALAVEGLVSLLPNRGAIVSAITDEEIDELFPIIGALEGLAGEKACAQAGDADLDGLERLHEEMFARFEAGEESAYRRVNRQFHEALFEIAGNRALSDLYQTLLVRIHSARFNLSKSTQDWRMAMDDHTQMMEALRSRNGARLAEILRHHLTDTATQSAQQSMHRSRKLDSEG